MPVIPLEGDGILADRGYFRRLGFFFVHREGAGLGLRRFPDLAAGLFPLFITGSAGAGIAQPGEGVGAAMSILPVDLHASPSGFVHPHRFGISGIRIREAFMLLDPDLPSFLGRSNFERLVGHRLKYGTAAGLTAEARSR